MKYILIPDGVRNECIVPYLVILVDIGFSSGGGGWSGGEGGRCGEEDGKRATDIGGDAGGNTANPKGFQYIAFHGRKYYFCRGV